MLRLIGFRSKKCWVSSAFLYIWIALLVLVWEGQTVTLNPAIKKNSQTVFGGPCEYSVYKGKARIVSINKRHVPNSSYRSSLENYDVKFCFSPDVEIEDANVVVEGKQYRMMLDNSRYPGPKFLIKYGIEVGKIFKCNMKVISSGTCTPILFQFPAIDYSNQVDSH